MRAKRFEASSLTHIKVQSQNLFSNKLFHVLPFLAYTLFKLEFFAEKFYVFNEHIFQSPFYHTNIIAIVFFLQKFQKK